MLSPRSLLSLVLPRVSHPFPTPPLNMLRTRRLSRAAARTLLQFREASQSAVAEAMSEGRSGNEAQDKVDEAA